MKLSVSNIAWSVGVDAEALAALAESRIGFIEVAPTRVWPNWEGITPASVSEFRQRLQSAGFGISSLQSILFQKPELRLFGSREERTALHNHLSFCAGLARDLGATCMVFGSPKNRTRGALSEPEALSIATDFFTNVVRYCHRQGVFIGFEANPADYACDFATESQTAAALVRAVGSPGFRLHLDTACMYLAGEPAPPRVIAHNRDILSHFHVSEPFLGDFSAPVAGHNAAAAALRDTAYPGFTVLEMRAADPPLPALRQAIRFLRTTYGDPR